MPWPTNEASVMKPEAKSWIAAAKRLPANSKEQYRLVQVFQTLLAFVHEMEWQGACHATTAVLTVLLRELDLPADPCLGECSLGGAAFDHSWVEIRGDIYDVAVSNSLIPGRNSAPVFAGKSLMGSGPTEVRYGIESGHGLDPQAQFIRNMSFSQYMDNFVHHHQGLWGIAKDVGKRCGMRLDAGKLREKHSGVQWHARA